MTETAVSSADFRGAMRHLTGGVSVITAGRGKDITGMTVTSVTSLAVDPPTLLVSINRDASSFPLIRRYGAFGVNILAADQLDVAERFAGKGGLKGADRFAGSQWVTAVSGVPLLVGALSAVDCEVEEIVERHSHGIVIARRGQRSRPRPARRLIAALGWAAGWPFPRHRSRSALSRPVRDGHGAEQ
jgi:flavin reductase (DIM6/NTAB) family NADH-FMN oxidoreductase RutF